MYSVSNGENKKRGVLQDSGRIFRDIILKCLAGRLYGVLRPINQVLHLLSENRIVAFGDPPPMFVTRRGQTHPFRFVTNTRDEVMLEFLENRGGKLLVYSWKREREVSGKRRDYATREYSVTWLWKRHFYLPAEWKESKLKTVRFLSIHIHFPAIWGCFSTKIYYVYKQFQGWTSLRTSKN